MFPVLRDASLLNPRRIIFTGGEPLLRNDILELAQSLKNAGNDIKSVFDDERHFDKRRECK